jgi:chromate transporter
MTKTFVQQRRDVSQTELTEIFSFCQMLPGPSSTQTITLIGYKRGGPRLAVLTLLVWMLPACLLMTSYALLLTHVKDAERIANLLRFVQPMAIGFLIYAIVKAMQSSIKHVATFAIMLVAALVTVLLRSPWVFPCLLVVGSIVSNASSKRIPDIAGTRKPIKWVNLVWFFICFAVIATLSELARLGHWQNARLFNMFENFYRFGSLTWGGGHALMPIMHEQFIALPIKRGVEPWLNNQQFLTGFGMMNSVPGPVFSVSAYVGAIAMQPNGLVYQLLGALVASVGVFLPSTLLVFFLFPLYNNLKQNTRIFRALEGITAVVIGTMCASVFILAKTLQLDLVNCTVIAATFLVLQFTKLPAPVWVLICILAAALMP